MDVLTRARRSLNQWRTPVTTLLQPGAPIRARANAPQAVVIGAGFGGLAAAVRLLVRGYRVTVLERLDQAGGRARVFRDAGFTFDAGPTIVTAPFLFEELWALAGERMSDHVELVPTTPFYRIRFGDGQCFDYTGDPAAMRKEIARFNPRDVEGWERLLEHAEKIFDVGFTALAHAPFGKVTDMARVAPDMVRLENYRTVYGLVSKYIEDERLRQVFSFHPLLIGGNPMAASSIYTLIAHLERKWGVHFAMGGTGALVTGLVSLIERLGGEVRLGVEVEEIMVEQGRARGVRLKGRERIEADVVISNADSAWTYRHLIAPEHRKHWTDRRLDRSRYSMGLFVWYFGTKQQYPDVAHHTIMLGPRYQALLNDIFENKVLADDFSLYLHRHPSTDRPVEVRGRTDRQPAIRRQVRHPEQRPRIEHLGVIEQAPGRVTHRAIEAQRTRLARLDPIERQVDATPSGVLTDVARDVGELHRHAEIDGPCQHQGSALAHQERHRHTHRRGHPRAVAVERGQRRIRALSGVPGVALEQRVQRRAGQSVRGHDEGERAIDRIVARVPAVDPIESVGQRRQRRARVVRLIDGVVRDPAERIEHRDRIPQARRQHPRGRVERLAARCQERAAVRDVLGIELHGRRCAASFSGEGTTVSSTRAVERTPGKPAPGWVPAPTR